MIQLGIATLTRPPPPPFFFSLGISFAPSSKVSRFLVFSTYSARCSRSFFCSSCSLFRFSSYAGVTATAQSSLRVFKEKSALRLWEKVRERRDRPVLSSAADATGPSPAPVWREAPSPPHPAFWLVPRGTEPDSAGRNTACGRGTQEIMVTTLCNTASPRCERKAGSEFRLMIDDDRNLIAVGTGYPRRSGIRGSY